MGRARERPQSRRHTPVTVGVGFGLPTPAKRAADAEQRLRTAREYPFTTVVVPRVREPWAIPYDHPLKLGIPDASYECQHDNLPMTPRGVRELEGCFCWNDWDAATPNKTEP